MLLARSVWFQLLPMLKLVLVIISRLDILQSRSHLCTGLGEALRCVPALGPMGSLVRGQSGPVNFMFWNMMKLQTFL